MRQITKDDLDRLIEVYKNGINKWFRDELFNKDCAYYEVQLRKVTKFWGLRFLLLF